MIRDPLYQKIAQTLQQVTDGDLFQRCACSILGKEYLDLTPYPGGNDAGMDGAFGSPDGPWPLICTVQDDVIGNFTGNVNEYLKRRRGPKRAAIATTQQLTPQKKRNLEERAHDLGIKLVNIFDAPYFVEQLYRNSVWRRELLGVTGTVPALSIYPKRGRCSNPELLIGREEDVEWLENINSDALIVGQPGSGKTYLHQCLAKKGRALFVVSTVVEAIADALRDSQPEIVVIDDAHTQLDLLEELVRLRTELGAAFLIHANCWPSGKGLVESSLSLKKQHIRGLKRLRRTEIYRLIEELGIRGPEALQHLLIANADGRPGLAVALVECCKAEGGNGIWSGEAAAKELLSNRLLRVDEKTKCVLAAFAIGGREGMSLLDVGDSLGLVELDVRNVVTELGSGGLVADVSTERIQVRPPAIRSALVRDVFFDGPRSHSSAELLRRVPSAESTAEVIFGARQRGAVIDQDLLERLAVTANSANTWKHFAYVDDRCAAAVIDRYPEHVRNAAAGLLHHRPKGAVAAILDGIEDASEPESTDVDAKKDVEEWLFSVDLVERETIDRRSMLLEILEARSIAGRRDTHAFAWALSAVLRLRCERSRMSLAKSNEIVSQRRIVSEEVLQQLVGLWPRIRQLAAQIRSSDAHVLFKALNNWCFSGRLETCGTVSKSFQSILNGAVPRMLLDLCELPQCNRAWRTQIAWLATHGRFPINVDVDPIYEAVFGDDRTGHWEDWWERRLVSLWTLADDLQKRPVIDVVKELAELQAEADEFQPSNRGQMHRVYANIAQTCDNPEEWLSILLEVKASHTFVMPFVERLPNDHLQYRPTLYLLFSDPNYRTAAFTHVLNRSEPDDEVLSALLGHPNLSDDLDTLRSLSPATSVSVTTRLLTHPDSRVRGAAAIGVWHQYLGSEIPADLIDAWRTAVIEIGPDLDVLAEVFCRYPDLGFSWLKSRIKTTARQLHLDDAVLHAIGKPLSHDQRTTLLAELEDENYSDDLFDTVLGDDLTLFSRWLEQNVNRDCRLRPLDRDIGPRWESMALIALNAGVSPEELAEHCMPTRWESSCEWSDHFLRRIPQYEALSKHPDLRLRPAGRRGLDMMKRHAAFELEQERYEDSYID